MSSWNLLNKKMFTPLAVLVTGVAIAVITAGLMAGRTAARMERTAASGSGVTDTSPQGLYARAVRDAMVIEPEDVQPLIEVAEGAPFCSWKNGKVLMLTWHRYPDSYVPGEEYTLKYGIVWTFTDKEIASRYREEKARGVKDWDLRLRQLIGVPPDKTYTHFTAMWTDPEDLKRPGYAWKLSDTIGTPGFSEKPDDAYKAWFDGNIIWSYFDSAYPWTRLGYTYDWAGTGRKYGVSEFIIRKDAKVDVEFTLSTGEFLKWLEDGAIIETADATAVGAALQGSR